MNTKNKSKDERLSVYEKMLDANGDGVLKTKGAWHENSLEFKSGKLISLCHADSFGEEANHDKVQDDDYDKLKILLSLQTPFERIFGGRSPSYKYSLLSCPSCASNELLHLEVVMFRYKLSQDLKTIFKERFSLNRFYIHCANRECDADSRYNENLRFIAYRMHEFDLKRLSERELLQVESRRIGKGIENHGEYLNGNSPERTALGGSIETENRDLSCPHCGSSDIDLFEERIVKSSIDRDLKLTLSDDFTIYVMFLECQKCLRNSKESKQLREVALSVYYEIFCFGGWR